MRVMVIECKSDELVDERYKDTIMHSSKSLVHWDTIEISRDDYQRYEDLRIELDELVMQLKGSNK